MNKDNVLRHADITSLGLIGPWDRYRTPNERLILDTIEDDDRMDRFRGELDGVDVGMVKTVGRLEELIALSNKTKDCPDCNGEGTIYIDTSRSCTKTPWQECCGGCGYDEECETCKGRGQVDDEYEIVDNEDTKG